jgi:hypothetical protein
MTSEKKHDKNENIVAQSSFRRELLLALVQHGIRPAATVIVALLIFIWLSTAGLELSMLKGPGFEARFDREVANKDLRSELESLQTLDRDQLQLFLIVGRDRGTRSIHYTGPEAQIENWEALQRADLLKYNKLEGERVEFTLTPKANLLHKVLFDSLYESIQ